MPICKAIMFVQCTVYMFHICRFQQLLASFLIVVITSRCCELRMYTYIWMVAAGILRFSECYVSIKITAGTGEYLVTIYLPIVGFSFQHCSFRFEIGLIEYSFNSKSSD